MKNSREILAEDQYWTIVVPSFNRFHYLERLIRSLEEKADMPYELIVHDDGSSDGAADKIYQVRNKISTIIYNNGLNMGLGRSSDRCMSLANSKYILFMNDDCIMKNPCLKDMKNVLDKEYIGSVGIKRGQISKKFMNNGTRFGIIQGTGTGYSFGIRKDVWTNSGGWDYDAFSGAADSAFQGKICQAGYFFGMIDGECDELIDNASLKETGGNDTSMALTGGFDNSYPKLFGINDNQYRTMSKNRHNLCTSRIHSREKNEGDNCNLGWWINAFRNIVVDSVTIDWEKAEKYPQFLKWKDQIESEKIYE